MSSAGNNSGSSLDQTEMRFLVEKNADGIIVVDENGVVLFANPAAEEIFGRPTGSLVGSVIGIPVISGDTAEIAVHRPKGQLVEAEVRLVDTIWNDRPARLASLRDVSARKAMEERLRHSTKMEAIGRLTAGIAHDFNNLLTVVLGNLESAQRQSSRADPAVHRALENASRGALRAADLTERLLAFARRKPLEPKVIDVNSVVAGMTDMLRRTLGESVGVRTMLASDVWPVDVDPTELEAAIVNLAVNARDAMPSGGDLLVETANLRLPPSRIDRVSVAAGDYVVVTVSDSGVGMTQEVLRQVFEPFFTTKGGRGTGLGLSQVYGFATQSGGTATLYSEPGMGTTARIYLPKAAAQPVASPASTTEPPKVEAPRGSIGEAILVVEDDDDVRNYTVQCLRELGYLVFEAADAAAARKVVERESAICLLLTDLGLPGGMDGKTLGEHLRALRPSLKVLITTAYAANRLVHDGRLDPDVDLLNKPFTRDTLATRIREMLDRGDGKAPRLLVVEDEVLVRMLVAQTLVGLGCQVEEAGSFREALGKFESIGDELAGAIIDLGLPDQPGDKLVEKIRSARPNLPVVLATGYADDAMRQRWSKESFVAMLPKPFQPHDIKAVLERLGLRVQRPR